jgi:hypothetical protein
MLDAEGLTVHSPQGGKAHPAVVELRAQRLLLARLIVALRVPLGDQADKPAGWTQRRGVRGVYSIKASAA